MRHTREISRFFSSVCIKDTQPFVVENISKPSTPSICSAFKQEQFHPSEIYAFHKKFDLRQRIRNFLYLKKLYGKEIAEALSGRNDLEIIAHKYGLYEEHRILHIIINILLEKQEYFKEKDIFDNAIKVVLSGQTIQDTVQMFNMQNVYQISVDSLTREFNKYMQLTMTGKEYKYDKNINGKCEEDCKYTKNIIFAVEFSLLDFLSIQKEKCQSSRSCQICTLEFLFDTFCANNLIIRKEILSRDIYEKVNENWMYEFAIRHSEKISEFAPDCKKDIISLWTKASEIFSILFDKRKSSENLDPCLLISEIHMISDVRKKIREYLNLNNRLEKAADQVLNKKTNVVTVAEMYGLNSKKDRNILDKKISILTAKNKYLKLKDNIDRAINDILNYRKKYDIEKSLSMAAKKYDIPCETLSSEFEKFCQLKITYKFDQPIQDGVFTFIEEFSLLEKLHLWKTTTQDCICQACALECVFKLAYILANIIKRDLKMWGNKIKRENWICEFQMRHSKEISKYSNYFNCTEVKPRTSTSASQSFVAKNISKSSIWTHQETEQKELNVFQTFYINMSRKKIKKYLEIKDKLEAATNDVLSGEKDIQTAAKSYGLSKIILNRKVNISKEIKKYLLLEDKFFMAVSEFVCGVSTIPVTANYHQIEIKTLENEINERIYLDNGYVRVSKYNYRKSLDNPPIFKLREEYYLLKELDFWKQISQPYCFCQLCAMETLLQLANQYAQRGNSRKLHDTVIKRWNKIKRPGMRWLMNFEMRYTISKSFLPDCIKVPNTTQKLKNKSKSSRLVSKSHRCQKFNQLQILNAEGMSTSRITSDDKNQLQPLDLTSKCRKNI